MTRVLITGAAGHIGRALRAGFQGHYALRLADIAPQAEARPSEEIVTADITRLEDLLPIMEGIDVVVHLAGVPDEDRWKRIRDMNIEGCYNVFEAARQAGVKRVVFASSNHAVGFHRRDRMIDNTVEPRPDSRYGISKVFGEALGRMYADKHGMSVACIRIGSFRPDDQPSAPDLHFAVVYGVSGNARNRWDNANVRYLGFAPEDDAELHAARITATGQAEDAREALFHGGFGCLVEFDGDPLRID